MIEKNAMKIISLVSRCKEEKISISLLMNSLRLIEKGLIRESDDLQKYLQNRSQRNPVYKQDAQKINEMIVSTNLL